MPYKDENKNRECKRIWVKKWRKENKKLVKKNDEKYRSKNHQKIYARRMVRDAIKNGNLKRGECELKDKKCYGRIDAHHQDYSKPLKVTWLCISHHRKLHRGSVKLDNK